MVNSDYSIYQKPKSWISRLSVRARDIMTKTQQNHGQVSILSAPEILPSPASSVTSVNPTDDEDCSAFVTPSPSSSTSSCVSIFLLKEYEQTSQNRPSENQEMQQHNRQTKKHLLPPSPRLTAYDKLHSVPYPECDGIFPPMHSTSTTIPSPVLPPLKNNSYFSSGRPPPTKRRTPGRNRHSSIEINKPSRGSILLKNDNEPTRHSVALEKLAHDTLTYFVDTSPEASSSSYSESPSSSTNAELCDKNADHAAKLVEKLKSRLTSSSTSIHPSILKLAQDVMTYINEAPPLTNECQQLKPKLEVCLMIHGKPVN